MKLASQKSKLPILIAEDDSDDQLLLKVALEPFEDVLDLHFVEDGVKLMEYLHHTTKNRAFPPPKMILLDIQMPRKNGRQVLLEIKNDPKLRHIPVIVWTTSSTEADRRACMDAGAEGYVTKPPQLADLKTAIKGIVEEWLLSKAKRS